MDVQTHKKLKLGDWQIVSKDPDRIANMPAFVMKLYGGRGSVVWGKDFVVNAEEQRDHVHAIIILEKDEVCISFGRPSIRRFWSA